MGSLVIVLYLALFSIVFNVGAKDVPTKEIVLKADYQREASNAVPPFLEEQEVDMIPKDFVTAYEGETLFIEFAEVPDNITKCVVIAPEIHIVLPSNRWDLELRDNCTMTFRNVSNDINGQWTFKIHGNVIFTGKINVTVIMGAKDVPTKEIALMADYQREASNAVPPFLEEQEVDMIPKDFVTAYEGETLFIEFAEVPDNITKCVVIAPEIHIVLPSNRWDLELRDNCTMTFRNVSDDINGQWTFKIHGNVIFTGKINVTVIMGAKDVPTKEITLKADYQREASNAVPPFLEELGAKDVAVPAKEITLKTEYLGEASYAVPSDPSSELVSCYLQSPNGSVYQLFPMEGANLTNSNINFVSTPTHHCGFEIQNIDNLYLGKWLLTTSSAHFFDEKEVSMHSITIQLDEQIPLKTERLGTIYYGISLNPLINLTTCILQRENGVAYQLYPALEGNITDPNIKYKKEINSACGFEISNITIGHQGVWTLSTEFTELMGEKKSVTQPLLISIEEEVGMIPKDFVTVYEGETVFIVFPVIPDNVTGCDITVPGANNQSSTKELAQRFFLDIGTNCSMTFRNVTDDINGQWLFKILSDVVFTGKINITVIPIPTVDTTPLDLQLGSTASLTFGPNDATYCRATDPTGLVLVKQNGPCSLRLPVVGKEHDGQWKIQLGLPGITDTRTYTYTVNVNAYNADTINPDTIVSSVEISNNGKTLQMVCSLMVPSINSCRMVRSDGNVFTPIPYLGNGRYSYYGKETYKDSKGKTIVDCGIEVREAEDVDLLRWQCIMTHGIDNTEVGAFIDILEKDDPRLEDIVGGNSTTEDVWNPSTVTEIIKNSYELKCSQPQKIEYCWFLSPNGTQLVAIPGASNPVYEYVGRGLSFGECGIKMKNASLTDSGNWVCNMGTANETDITRTIPVKIYNSGVVNFYSIENTNTITIGCRTYDNTTLEYCRFVRPDGQGINPLYANNTAYTGNGTSLSQGICQLTIRDVVYQDLGTWSCIGKSAPSAEEHRATVTITRYQYYTYSSWNSMTWIFYFISLIGLVIIMVLLVQRAKLASRLKTRAASFRQSFRDRKMKRSQSQTEAETRA